MQFCVLTVQVCVNTVQICVITVQICVITVQVSVITVQICVITFWRERKPSREKQTNACQTQEGDIGGTLNCNTGGGGNREIPQHCCIYVHVDKHVDRNILHICIFIVHVDKISGLPMRHLFLEQASNHLQDMRWLHLTFHDYILIERIHHLYVL